MKKITSCFALFLVASLIALTAYSNSFEYRKTAPGMAMRYIGPGAGGSMFGMAFHPSNPDIIVFGGDMGASYRSENAGKSWDIMPGDSENCPRDAWNIRFHPQNHNIVWHLGSAILKSTDTGKNWKNTNAPKGTYCALGLDPDNAAIAYAAEGQAPRSVLDWTFGTVIKTTNGGKTWRKLKIPGITGKRGSYRNNFTNFIIDPDSPVIKGEGHSRVFIFGRGGLFRSDDAGKTWQELSKSFGPGQVNDMVMTKNNGKTTFFLSVAPSKDLDKGGVYKSTDNGNSWTAANKGLESLIKQLKRYHTNLKSKPQRPLFAILLATSKANPNRIYVGSWRGIYRSDNGGKSWYQLAPAEGCGYIKDKNNNYISIPKKGSNFKTSIWGGIDNFNRFIIDPKNPDRIAFSDNQDMYLSTDGGKMWDSLIMDYGKAFDQSHYPNTRPNRYTHKVISRGPQNLVCDQIVIDPFNPQTYYAACMDVGLQVSHDSGKSWEHPTRGMPGRGHAWTVVADPGKKGRVFITTGQAYRQAGGLYLSNNSGRNWQRLGVDSEELNKHPKTGKLQSVALDLKSPVNSRIIYIGSEKNGVYKSIDGGKSWKNISTGLTGKAKNVMTVQISPKSSKTLYAGTMVGLFISKNAGKSWTRLGKGSFDKVKSLSICKAQPSTIYVCANYPGQSFYWGKAGYWRSTNGGKSFTNITPKYFKYAGAITVNPYNPNYIYGCNDLINTSETGQKMIIVRSKDGGKTWGNISADMACNRSKHIFIDQKDPQRLFVLTRFGIIEATDANAPIK